MSNPLDLCTLGLLVLFGSLGLGGAAAAWAMGALA